MINHRSKSALIKANQFNIFKFEDQILRVGIVEDTLKLNNLTTSLGKKITRLPKATRMGIAASIEAFEKNDVDNYMLLGENWGVFAAMQTEYLNQGYSLMKEAYKSGPQYISPKQFPNSVLNSLSGWLSISFGILGPNITVTNGENSVVDAIKMGTNYINYGIIKNALIVTSETITPFILENTIVTKKQYLEVAYATIITGEERVPKRKLISPNPIIDDYFKCIGN